MRTLRTPREEPGKETREGVVVYFGIGIEKVEGDVDEGGG